MSRTSDAGHDLVDIEVEAAQPSGAAVGRVRPDEATARSTLAPGTRVVVGPFDPCGECDVCRRGGVATCAFARRRGEMGNRLRASSRWLVALDDGLELPGPAAAAIAGDVAVAYTLYARTGVAPRDPVVVVGATAVTRFLVEILRAKSIAPAVVAPGDAAWCAWLARTGARVVRDDAADLRAAVAEAIAAEGLGARPWRVIATDDVATAAALAGPRATLAVLADRAAAPCGPIDGALLAREVTIVGVAGAHPDLVVEAAAMARRGEIDLAGGVELVAPGEPARDRTRATVSVSASR